MKIGGSAALHLIVTPQPQMDRCIGKLNIAIVLFTTEINVIKATVKSISLLCKSVVAD
jgi:hypothetical protein